VSTLTSYYLNLIKLFSQIIDNWMEKQNNSNPETNRL